MQRFEIGKKLTAEEKRELLAGMRDSYLELGADKGLKGFTYDGDPIEGYLPHQYDFMMTSDVTGQKIRYFLVVDGVTFHPSELYPSIGMDDIKRAAMRNRYALRVMCEAVEAVKKAGVWNEVVEAYRCAQENAKAIERRFRDQNGHARTYIVFRGHGEEFSRSLSNYWRLLNDRLGEADGWRLNDYINTIDPEIYFQ